jgi:hypothetical protein
MPLCIPFQFWIGESRSANIVLTSGIPAWAKQEPPMLSALVTNYSHTIADRYGFESASLTYTGDRNAALGALNLLSRPLTVASPYGSIPWDGLIYRVTAKSASEQHSISMESLANWINVRFTASFGTSASTVAGGVTIQDATSQERYGRKDYVATGGAKTLTAATALGRRILAERKSPLPENGVHLQTGDATDNGWEITLECVGLYEELGWCLTSNTATTSTQTTSQLTDLLLSDPNSWIGLGTITASGISDVVTMPEDSTRRQKIEELLGQGNSSNQPLSWGVYEDRLLTVVPWAGAVSVPLAPGPTRIYATNQQEMTIRNGEGSIVNWWDVRPNAVYRLSLLDSATITTAGNSTTTGVIGRVSFSCSESDMSLDLEGVYQSSADALIARVRS